jgi:hypothetical protein
MVGGVLLKDVLADRGEYRRSSRRRARIWPPRASAAPGGPRRRGGTVRRLWVRLSGYKGSGAFVCVESAVGRGSRDEIGKGGTVTGRVHAYTIVLTKVAACPNVGRGE